ncbi:IDEAL domain-containing protein [Peribacillus sp. NPDC097295]|uniref:IDEAL domain-containing protein n=1 Tax=Peribacillus sp. NPDC097295 TaxID=3364402 RepID=UPI003818D36D
MEKQLPITPLEPEMMETLAEMVLIKALNDYRKNQIEKEIDHSLEIRDKKEFIRLTNELKSLC